MLKYVNAVLIIATVTFSSAADDIFVNMQTGNDRGNGSAEAPLRNIRTAVDRAMPGDTVKLQPLNEPFSGQVIVRKKHRTVEQPIVIDGGFNTLLGSRRITERMAEKLENNLYRVKKRKIPWNFMIRFFMVFDGKVERMGQHSKDKSSKLKKPEELVPLEWTIVNNTDLYFKLPPEATLETVEVREPIIINGVNVDGKSENIIVKNLIVKHFWNDGYNIHDNYKNIVFDTVAAIDCGDDGASGHEGCVVTVRNFVSIGNGTGVCHGGTAEGTHENIYIENAAGRDIFMLNIKNSFDKLAIRSHAMATSEFGDKGVNTVNHARIYSDNPARLMRTRNAKSVTGSDNKIVNYKFDGVFPGMSSPPPSPDDVKKDVEAARADIMKLFKGKLQ